MSKAWIAIVPLAVLLSGCAGHLTVPTPVPTVTDAVPTPSATPTPTPTIPNGAVASGTLASSDIATTGTIHVWNTNGEFMFFAKNVASKYTGQTMMVLSDTVLKLGDCAENDNYEIATPIEHGNASVLDAEEDPSYFASVSIVQYPVDGKRLSGGCQQKVLATTALHWKVPDTRPNLTVIDRGPRSGARGEVQGDDYLTAASDNWYAIAARFSITFEDLDWLNPRRIGAYLADVAYADELLNLSKMSRGDSRSRRP